MAYPAVLAMPWDEMLRALDAAQTMDAEAMAEHARALAAMAAGG